MIKVYDMTSGTLREELEATTIIRQDEIRTDEVGIPALNAQLQEYDFNTPDNAQAAMPTTLLQVNSEKFLDEMK
jgi:hypothetical protein